jgi:hypothetical protein
MNRNDEAAPQARVVVRVGNPSSSSLLVRIEPWAEEVELEPGGSHEALLAGPDPADVEVRVASSEVTIYGWVGSELDGNGLRVPRTPPRMG